MFCPKCGSQVLEGTKFCFQCGAPVEEQPPVESVMAPPVEEPVVAAPETPAEPVFSQPVAEQTPVAAPATKEKKPKRKFTPTPPVRILLRIASAVLCFFLIGSLIATAFVIDMQRLMDQDNVDKVVDSLLQEDSSQTVLTLARKANRGSSVKLTREQLIAWIFEVLKERGGAKMTVTEEQVIEFLDKSNAEEFLSDKIAGFITDFIKGTEETTLRKSEIIEMLEENERAAEEAFNVELNSAVKQDVTNFMERNDVENLIRKEVFTKMEAVKLIDDYDVGELLEDLRDLTSVGTLILLILLDIALIGLLWLTNWLRISSTMKCAGISMAVAGGLLSVPTMVLQFVPSILETFGGGLLAGIIQALVGVMAPVHYTLLGLGLVFIITSIVVKILTKAAKA